MTDNVTSFEMHTMKRAIERGEAQFLLCPHCESETPCFAPAIMFNDGKPFLSALVCLSDECNGDTHIDVVNGYAMGYDPNNDKRGK